MWRAIAAYSFSQAVVHRLGIEQPIDKCFAVANRQGESLVRFNGAARAVS